ncbi:glycoside hydrolase family 17 protein [Ramaria rubella]|nr:glycoside hydrolase family 17 protein [Ramaria rubella]
MGRSLGFVVWGWLILFILSQEQCVQVFAAVVAKARKDTDCFPFGSARLPVKGLRAPEVARDEWWCPQDLQYGFMGFSYPLEMDNCSDPSNLFPKINQDFQRMKHQFGATMVRIYAPQCRNESIWQNLLHAGLANNMAVLPQVWWGFEANQSLWKLTADSIVSLLEDPILGPIAPYVFHSIAFGSEPIGDDVDGGPDQFTADLKTFKARVEPFGIPITISEDWDRPGIMSGQNWTGLGPVGMEIAPVIDLVHVHIMPYYHADIFPTADNIWPYFETYIPFLQENLPGKPILISQTLWSSIEGGSHDRGFGNPSENLGNFTLYWDTILSKCEYFKQHKVGWFVHTYDDSQEPGLGMIDDSGHTKMYFNPPTC